MKSEKILVLLDSKNNENLLNLSVSLAKNDKSTLYFIYVVEVPHKYPVEYEIGNQISLGENLLREANNYLSKKRLEYDINSENFILVQSRNAGVATIKESKRINPDTIIFSKNSNNEDYKYSYIKKYAEVNIIELINNN